MCIFYTIFKPPVEYKRILLVRFLHEVSMGFSDQSLFILALGIFIILAIILKSRLKKIGLPSNIGFIALGFLVRFLDSKLGFLSQNIESVFEILMKLGIIVLLFEIGLESNLEGLLRQLRAASAIWTVDVSVSGFSGFAISYWLCGNDVIPSLFVAAALTATSVGISVGVWKETGSLQSKNGRLLLDIAELDDISGIILMALIFALSPVLKNSENGNILIASVETLGLEIGKLLGFGGICFLFSKYVEKPYTSFFKRLAHRPDPMITMVGTTFMFAALAGFLGFSVAIGAFFAGLIYSRDPEALRMETSFNTLYDFFVPFFFIGIGLSMEVSTIGTGLIIGLILLIAAVGGKILAVASASRIFRGKRASLLLGLSMVPRAEIAVIIMEKGLSLGKWAVTPTLFSAMVVISLVTTMSIPVILRVLLRRWPQGEGKKEGDGSR